jgi:hypothetical protein
MRLWSLAPASLDPKGLVACWREALLAQAVLAGKTKGYRQHPQLIRFRESPDPLGMLGLFLLSLWEEAEERGYSFDRARILCSGGRAKAGAGGLRIGLNAGQLAYEASLLRRKLQLRDSAWLSSLPEAWEGRANPLFSLREGPIEDWERPLPELLVAKVK